MKMKTPHLIAATLFYALHSAITQAADVQPPNANNNVYFGDVHVHTGWSFDAFTNGSKTTPMDAYAWAQGKAITGSGGPEMQIRTPLDFYMVADHAEYMGVFNQMANPDSPLSKTELAKGVTSPDANVRIQTFAGVLRDMSAGKRDPQLSDPVLAGSVWAEIVKAADANYTPGKFTTFAGFEWTSNPQQAQPAPRRRIPRHRNICPTWCFPRWIPMILKRCGSGWTSSAPKVRRCLPFRTTAMPATAACSSSPSSTASRSMPPTTRHAPQTSRCMRSPRSRARRKPIPTCRQTTNSPASSNGITRLSADSERPTHRQGSFARQALLDGMSQAASGAGNPFKYGFIGDTDTHNAAATNEEFNFTGKFAFENNARERLTGVPGAPAGQVQQIQEFSSGGLAGVWAPENTREAIWDAMQRRKRLQPRAR